MAPTPVIWGWGTFRRECADGFTLVLLCTRDRVPASCRERAPGRRSAPTEGGWGRKTFTRAVVFSARPITTSGAVLIGQSEQKLWGSLSSLVLLTLLLWQLPHLPISSDAGTIPRGVASKSIGFCAQLSYRKAFRTALRENFMSRSLCSVLPLSHLPFACATA